MKTRRSLIRTALTLGAAVASFLTVYALCRATGAQAQPAILACILALSLARRSKPASIRRLLTAPAVIASTALAAGGVGWLLHVRPPLGAAVFTAGMFGSIWLRNFGARWRSFGALIALPLVAMLVVPARATAPGGVLVDFALIVCAGIVALIFVTAIGWLAARAGIVLADGEPERGESSRTSAGVAVPTRMALQMAAALGAAFVVGFRMFPAHWSWTVLTAFIVCSGARGRGDAAYTGILRLFGAVVGTLAAAVVARLWAPSGAAEAAAIFGLLFFAVWLRETNYAYWAGFVTLILALLTRSDSGLDIATLDARLAAIFVGAACAVAAAWFIFPIRTQAIIRRRLADALSALDDAIAHAALPDAALSGRQALFEHRIAELRRVALPVVWYLRLVPFRAHPEHPGRWIALTDGLANHAHGFIAEATGRERACGTVRRAIGAARRAIASHGKSDAPPDTLPVSVSLRRICDALAQRDYARRADASTGGSTASHGSPSGNRRPPRG